jgi:aspartate/methionine/tyrosine aminotransferase
MKINVFELERFFARYEFSAKYILGASDCEGLAQKELLAMADKESSVLWENLKLGYTESQGHPLLREEISLLYEGVYPNEMITMAPEEGIFMAMNALLDKEDHVIVTFPGYQSLYEIANSIGCMVTKWVPDAKKGWALDLGFLEKSIKPNTKLLVINFPHNPTGYLPPREKFLEIMDIARKHDLYVFSDEMYRFLEYEKQDRLPSACEIYDKAITLSGMSKIFALAGLRIGWLITKDGHLLKEFSSFKDYTTICSSAPSEILSIMALRNKGRIIERNLRIIKGNISQFEKFVSENNDFFSWVRPKAGSIAFPELVSGINVEDFCMNLLRKMDVMLLPSRVYGYDGNNFRIGFGRTNFAEALKKVEEYVIQCRKQ